MRDLILQLSKSSIYSTKPFHGFCFTVSGRFGWRYALCREKAATRRGALVRDSLSRKDEASENAGLL
ncbi:hypothetical protein [Klebsiella sp. 96093]|uniref:hypothetical protein n=1 Tax=Klebsiella sp. 96093 TaxID=3079154 RepID=UPI0030060AC6